MKENNTRILVADDYEANRKIAQLILQKDGYEVDIVENGQQAVEAYRQNRYDLILMDIQMPVMDGLEATKIIRKWESKMLNSEGGSQMSEDRGQKTDVRDQKTKDKTFAPNTQHTTYNTPIIAISGNAVAGHFDEALYPGMNDCIAKPLQRDALLAAVQKRLGPEPDLKGSEMPARDSDTAVPGSDAVSLPLDMDRALREFMGKKDILHGILKTFIAHAGTRIQAIHRAVKSRDYGVIMSEAHGIKGGAANLTADGLASIAADLEKAGEAQRPDLSAELADRLEKEFCSLENYIRQYPGI